MEHQKPEPELKAVHVHGDLQRKHAEHAARANAKYSTHSSRPRTRGEPLEPFEISTPIAGHLETDRTTRDPDVSSGFVIRVTVPTCDTGRVSQRVTQTLYGQPYV